MPPTGFARKGKLEPVTQIVTTGDKELAEDIAVESRSGVVEGLGDTRSSSDADSLKLAEKIFERSRRSPTRVLTQEKFGELWSLLEEAGIFDLPPSRSSEPPKDRPYFILESQGRRTIVGRPQVAAPSPDDPGVRLLDRWNSSKLVFFNFLNNP